MAIERVILKKDNDSHENEKRTILNMKHDSLTESAWEQVRIVQPKVTVELGNHWREFGELYCIIGEAGFTLEDIDTKERQIYKLKTGYSLYIPPRVAIKFVTTKDSIITVLSKEVDLEKESYKYEVS